MKNRENPFRPQDKNLVAPFKPGEVRNPVGRPRGSRSKFSEAMVADFLADWHQHGTNVLERVRMTEPATYLRVAAVLVPKEMNVAVEQRQGPMDTHEMRLLRRLVDTIDACGAANIADSETVLGWIEQDLRARLATPVEQK